MTWKSSGSSGANAVSSPATPPPSLPQLGHTLQHTCPPKVHAIVLIHTIDYWADIAWLICATKIARKVRIVPLGTRLAGGHFVQLLRMGDSLEESGEAVEVSTCTIDLGVAGENLLDERAAGARQADHKDGPRLLQSQRP